MSQPEITPLARRLAEENNVDWRGLHGSGAGGKVVERDVLEFLARVMAGEEDVDPTPEPVPEGLEAWPDEDVRSFQQEVQASRKDAGLDEIQQELSAADRLNGEAAQGTPAPDGSEVGPASAEADEISEDIFLFGDDSEEDDLGPGSWGQVEEQERPQAFGAPSAQEDDLLVAGEDDLDAGGEDEAELTAGGFGDADRDAVEGTGASNEALFEPGGERADVAGGEGLDAAARDGAAGEPGGLPDVFGGASWEEQEAWDSGSDSELFARQAGSDQAGMGEAGTGAEAPDDLEVPPLGDIDTGAAGGAGEPAWQAERAWESEPAEPQGPAAFDAGQQDADAAWDIGARPAEPPQEPAAPDAVEPAVPPPYEGLSGNAVGPEAAASEPDLAEAFEEAPTDLGGAPEEPLAGGAVGAEPPPAPNELPLVSYGTLLRRHLDVTALAGAQLSIGLELGEGEPLSPAPFLLRAAAKAVAEGGWGDGSVAMVALEGDSGVRLHRIDDAARRPFLELVRMLADGGTAGEDTAALSVVDMSALDVDEAVLNVGGPQLTLGRILYDNQRGSYRSTLSLAGEVPAERGAKLLARVAELLDAPVRLML